MIKYPYLILSDIHMNDWSQFSYIREDKINSRLYETMEAVQEATAELRKQGGRDIVITGDLFHTRGKIKPSVFNPVYDLFINLCEVEEFRVWCLPGNHDLEGKHSDTIGNAIEPFKQIKDFTIFNEVTELGNFVFLPWIEYKDDFVGVINSIQNPLEKTVFCHIGIDGVLEGVTGKVGKAVLDRGFKYVFSGDYHNHKALGDGVYSVGALTHHNFGDINSRAGYIIVSEEGVNQYETKAPKFLRCPALNKSQVFGNIWRLEGVATEEEAKMTKDYYMSYGAIHFQDLSTRPTITSETKSASVVRVDLSLEKLLETYTEHKYGENAKAVFEACMKVKNDVQGR